MNLTLLRKDKRADGFFGEMTDDAGNFYFTLEHAFKSDAGELFPKIKAGVHNLVLYSVLYPGQKSRHGYDVYVLVGVDDDGHFYEIHIGNYNHDSEGCILIGLGLGNTKAGGKMLTSSKQAFERFMKLASAEDKITLTVVDASVTE